MSNLEAAVRKKIDGARQHMSVLQKRADKLSGLADSRSCSELATVQQELQQADADLVTYLLEAVPYVREYFQAAPTKNSQLQALASAGGQCTWQVDDTQVQRRGTIYKCYMHTVENKPEFKEAPAPVKLFNACTDCPDAPELQLDSETSLVCPKCARCFPNTNYSFRNLSYEQQTTEVVQVACYRRSNHFSEWLSKLQAKELTKIPDEVMNSVKLELKKQRMLDTSKVSQAEIKEILKKLKLSKY